MDNYFIEKKDSDELIIAFTGNAQELMGDTFEFFAVTNTLNCNRILLKDPTKRIYLFGIGGNLNTSEKLLEKLKSDIENVNAKVVTIIGTSGGGFAAILYGHLLKANFVHAFGPTTQVAVGLLNKQRIKKNFKMVFIQTLRVLAIRIFSAKIRKYLDLKKVLGTYNGITQYNIYVCEGFEKDVLAANYLKDCKNVKVHKQPCNVHNVVRCMIKTQKLNTILNSNTGIVGSL